MIGLTLAVVNPDYAVFGLITGGIGIVSITASIFGENRGDDTASLNIAGSWANSTRRSPQLRRGKLNHFAPCRHRSTRWSVG